MLFNDMSGVPLRANKVFKELFISMYIMQFSMQSYYALRVGLSACMREYAHNAAIPHAKKAGELIICQPDFMRDGLFNEDVL